MVQLTLPKNSVPVKGKTYSNVELIDEQGQNNFISVCLVLPCSQEEHYVSFQKYDNVDPYSKN